MMTTDEKNLSSAAEDLAFVRKLAEEGRMRPLQGGKYLVMWGGISSFGLAFTALVVSGAVALPGWSIMVVWFALSAFGGIMSGRWGRQNAGTTEAESVGNKVEAIVWCIAGLFLFLVSSRSEKSASWSV